MSASGLVRQILQALLSQLFVVQGFTSEWLFEKPFLYRSRYWGL